MSVFEGPNFPMLFREIFEHYNRLPNELENLTFDQLRAMVMPKREMFPGGIAVVDASASPPPGMKRHPSGKSKAKRAAEAAAARKAEEAAKAKAEKREARRKRRGK